MIDLDKNEKDGTIPREAKGDRENKDNEHERERSRCREREK